MDRKHRFEALWVRLMDGSAAGIWAALDRGYSDPGRAYHNWRHIDSMLAGLDGVRSEAELADARFDEVELAIFFHDAVYDPSAKDNEAKSAALLSELAAHHGEKTPGALERVTTMILATASHAPSADVSTRLLLDLDLSVLGSAEADYSRYALNVRAEYAAVPEAAWRSGRAAVLRRFLDREAIYQTTCFRRTLEAKARRNLASEIAALEG